MSVDQQIREGLVMLDQKLPTPDTSTAYEEIVHEARTRTRRTRLFQGGLVAAAAVAVVVTGQLGGGAPDLTRPALPVGDPSSGETAEGWQVVRPTILSGTWRTPDKVSARDMAERVRGYGEYRKYLSGFSRLPGLEGDGARLTLTFRNAEVKLSVGKPSETNFIDWQHYELHGDTVYYRPLTGSGGRTTYTVDVSGDRLELAFVATNVDPVDAGLGEAPMQTGLYTTSVFERVG